MHFIHVFANMETVSNIKKGMRIKKAIQLTAHKPEMLSRE